MEEVASIVITGKATNDAALRQLIKDTTGVSAMQQDRWAALRPIIDENDALITPDLRRIFEDFQLHRFVDRLIHASMQDLRDARDEFSALRDLFFDAATALTFLAPLPDAFGFAAFRFVVTLAEGRDGRAVVVARFAPLMLIIRAGFPDYDERLRLLISTAPQLRAAASFVEFLPREYQGVHGLFKLQALTQAEQRDLVLRWARTHPNEAEIAGLELSEEA